MKFPREAKIGLMVLLAIAILYFSVAWVKTSGPFSVMKDHYRIQFPHASGLKEGDPVMVLGVPSGSVSSISLQGDHVEVRVDLNREIVLKEDALAEIQIKELMGGKMIDISPGVSPRNIPPGGVLIGKTAPDFAEALSRMGEMMEKLDRIHLDSLILDVEKVGHLLGDISQRIDPNDVGLLLKDLRQTTSSLNGLLADADGHRLVEKIDTALVKVNRLAGTAEATMESVSSLTAKLEAGPLENADSLISQIQGMMTETEKAVETLNKTMAKLESDETLVGRLMNDPQMAKDLDFTLDNLNKTLDHIRSKKIYVTMTLAKRQRMFDEKVQSK